MPDTQACQTYCLIPRDPILHQFLGMGQGFLDNHADDLPPVYACGPVAVNRPAPVQLLWWLADLTRRVAQVFSILDSNGDITFSQRRAVGLVICLLPDASDIDCSIGRHRGVFLDLRGRAPCQQKKGRHGQEYQHSKHYIMLPINHLSIHLIASSLCLIAGCCQSPRACRACTEPVEVSLLKDPRWT